MTLISGDKRADGRSFGLIILNNSDLNLTEKYYSIKKYIYNTTNYPFTVKNNHCV